MTKEKLDKQVEMADQEKILVARMRKEKKNAEVEKAERTPVPLITLGIY